MPQSSVYVLPPPAQPCVAVARSSQFFPVRRIYCVGRNYAEHAREMGADPTREAPFFFMKPADAVVSDGARIPYPGQTADFHYEAELVVAIGGSGVGLSPEQAQALVFGYGVGIDFTRRDLQAQFKKGGKPWDMAKGFDRSAPCSAIVPAARIGHPKSGRIELLQNGETRQSADIVDLIWSVPELLANLSTFVRLEPGDLVFTGTPAGVGPCVAGDRLTARVEGIGEVSVEITER
jgi:fumarylpyruvate hydrolase